MGVLDRCVSRFGFHHKDRQKTVPSVLWMGTCENEELRVMHEQCGAFLEMKGSDHDGVLRSNCFSLFFVD